MIEIREESMSELRRHAAIPIAFLVERVLELVPVQEGLGGIALEERAVPSPWVKNYDDVAEDRPTSWPGRFDLERWGLLGAYAEGARVGGVAIAFDTPDVQMLRGRRDLAVLWDVRVAPEWRGRGVGTALLTAAEEWARARGCSDLVVETQNVNVPACRFYVGRGFSLAAIDRLAYLPEVPDEVQLLWHKRLP